MFKQSHILQQATTSTSKAPAAQFRRGKAGYEVLLVNLRTMSPPTKHQDFPSVPK